MNYNRNTAFNQGCSEPEWLFHLCDVLEEAEVPAAMTVRFHTPQMNSGQENKPPRSEMPTKESNEQIHRIIVKVVRIGVEDPEKKNGNEPKLKQ